MFKTRLDNRWQAMKYIVYVTVISNKIGILSILYSIQAPHFKLYCVIWYPGLIPIAARSGFSNVKSLECLDMVPHEIVRLTFTSESMLSI